MQKGMKKEIESYYSEKFDDFEDVNVFFERINNLLKKTTPEKLYHVFQIIVESSKLYEHYQYLNDNEKKDILTKILEGSEGKCLSSMVDRKCRSSFIRESLIHVPELYEKYKPEFFKGDPGYLYLINDMFINQIKDFINECIKHPKKNQDLLIFIKNNIILRNTPFSIDETDKIIKLISLFKDNEVDFLNPILNTNNGKNKISSFIEKCLFPQIEYEEFIDEDSFTFEKLRRNFDYFLEKANEKDIYLSEILKEKELSFFVLHRFAPNLFLNIPFNNKNDISELLKEKINSKDSFLLAVYEEKENYKIIKNLLIEKEKYTINSILKENKDLPTKVKKRL